MMRRAKLLLPVGILGAGLLGVALISLTLKPGKTRRYSPGFREVPYLPNARNAS